MNDASATSHQLVLLDDPGTWPEPLHEFVRELIDGISEVPEYTCDLWHVLPERSETMVDVITGLRFAAFHCTRLLDHEVANIYETGLRLLTEELVAEKIDRAHAMGYLSTEDRDGLRERNCFAIGNATGREGKVCLVAGETALRAGWHGLAPFYGGWGGEAMNGYPNPHENPILNQIGSPAVVAVHLDMADVLQNDYVLSGIREALVGIALALEDPWCEIHHGRDIPGGNVVEIWQPGDSRFDQLRAHR